MPERDHLAEQPDQVRERIDLSRAEVAESILAIRDRLRIRYDWRRPIRRSPFLMLVGSFTMGFMMARRSPRERDDR